jgi:SAM-dependent methyltransferase
VFFWEYLIALFGSKLKLNERLKDIPSANAVAIDFLSEEFKERDFDLVYAYGVLHHFPNMEILLHRLNEIMATNATLISYDPLQTSLPVKIVRTLYRPFQSDADWEWPFTKKTVQQIRHAFNVTETRGILGKSKWVFLVNFLPISEEKKKNLGQKWHNQDWEKSANSDKILFSCMHLTMFMKKK